MPHRVEHADGHQAGQAQRKHNLEQYAEISAPVQFRRLHQAFRNLAEERPHQDHIIGTDCPGQHHRPKRVQQFQLFDYQESRNHAAAEKHREGAHQGQEPAPHQFFLAQRPGAEHGQQQVYRRPRECVQQRIPVTLPEQRILKDLFIGLYVRPYRNYKYIALQDRRFLGKRSGDDVEHRIQHRETDQQQENRVENLEYPAADRDPDAGVPACYLHSRSPFHHRLVSPKRLLSQLAKITSANPVTLWNIPTAVP